MAVIKNGKIRGKIGKYVYRIVDGQEIVQAHPKSYEQTESTKKAAAKFGNSSKTGSKIYQQTKSFASDFTKVKFYREIVSLLRGSVYFQNKELLKKLEGTKPDLTGNPEAIKWNLVQGAHPLSINKEVSLDDFLDGYPIVNFSEDQCIVQVPAFQYINGADKHPKEANYIELFASAYHTHTEMTYSLCDYTSGRLPIFEGVSEQSLTLPMEWMDNIQKEGIVYVCFGLAFYANADSRNRLNSGRFNPSAILGMWFKENHLLPGML